MSNSATQTLPLQASDEPLMGSVSFMWHPQYLVKTLETGQVLLLPRMQGNQQPLLLPQEPFSRLVSLVQPKRLQTLIEEDPALASPDVFYLMQQLVDAKLLVRSNLQQEYGLPLVADNGFCALHQDVTDAVVLNGESRQCQEPWFTLLANGLKDRLITWFGSVDGFKHESKEERYEIYLLDDLLLQSYPLPSTGRQILVQMTSHSILVLPAFAKSERASLKGLLTRMSENQPLRHALGESENGLPALPDKKLILTQSLIDTVAQCIADQVKQLALVKEGKAPPEFSRVFEVLAETSEVVAHPWVHARYHEPVVVDMSQPPKLKHVTALKGADGGSRTVTPDHTLTQLRPLISPLTGVINQFFELETAFDADMKIYQTGFFKKPKLNALAIGGSLGNDLQQVCLGKGVSPEQSKVSGLSEAIERRNALFDPTRPSLHGRVSDLRATGQAFYSHEQLTPYSARQFIDFADANHPESKRKQAAVPYDDDAIHWLPNWSLSHERWVYLPLTMCQAQTGLAEERFGRWHSNGCSAGNGKEEAVLQGLYELIERDATAIWWYNKIQRPQYDLTKMDEVHLGRFHNSLAPEFDYWVLDLTNDVNVPVMAAIARHKRHQGFVMGFGAHLNPELAAQRALTELCQLIPIRHQHSAPFDFDAMTEQAFLKPTETALQPEYTDQSSLDLKENIDAIVSKLASLGLESLIFDYTQADTPLHTLKVTVPGLCHIWPQLGNARLYEVPVALGWQERPLNEDELNAQLLYI